MYQSLCSVQPLQNCSVPAISLKLYYDITIDLLIAKCKECILMLKLLDLSAASDSFVHSHLLEILVICDSLFSFYILTVSSLYILIEKGCREKESEDYYSKKLFCQIFP